MYCETHTEEDVRILISIGEVQACTYSQKKKCNDGIPLHYDTLILLEHFLCDNYIFVP